MKTKQRIAHDKEKSMLLALEGYSKDRCSGKCVVHSCSHISDMFIINGITHKCGYTGKYRRIAYD